MSNLAAILLWLYPGTNPLAGDWRVEDDGSGPRITAWNVPNEPQPTEEEVMAREADWQASLKTVRPVADVAADIRAWIGAPLLVEDKMARLARVASVALAMAMQRRPGLAKEHNVPVEGEVTSS